MYYPIRLSELLQHAQHQEPYLWPPYGIGQAIIFSSRRFLTIFFLSSFFLAYPQTSQIGCLPYFHTWCGLSADLGCRSETCCKRLAENTGRKKLPFAHHRRTLLGYIFATKARIDNQKHTRPYNMVNFGRLAAEIGLLVWITTANLNGFRILAALLHSTQVVGVSQTLQR